MALSMTSKYLPAVSRLVAVHIEGARIASPLSLEGSQNVSVSMGRAESMKRAWDLVLTLADEDMRDELEKRDGESVYSFCLRTPDVLEELRTT